MCSNNFRHLYQQYIVHNVLNYAHKQSLSAKASVSLEIPGCTGYNVSIIENQIYM